MSREIKPWDGDEPVSDAVERNGLRGMFEASLMIGDREKAVGILRSVGVNDKYAHMLVGAALPQPELDDG